MARQPILRSLALRRAGARAVTDARGGASYERLVARADALRRRLPPAPVGVFLAPDASFVTALLAVWGAGGTPVPLSPLYPAAALAPLIEAVAPAAVVSSAALRHALPAMACEVVTVAGPEVPDPPPLDDYPAVCQALAGAAPDNALVFFTSGTTGCPKGVVWSQRMLAYQLETLSAAWRWSPDDRVLNVLPLHHIHGLVNVVLSAVYNGAHLAMHSAFDAHSVWHELLSPEPPTVFMAVPAVYRKLIAYYDAAPQQQPAMRAALRRVRLFVCGSASLPRAHHARWHQISGQLILERYGMTETGMTLSNPYDARAPGLLGVPLPGVETAVVDGELRVRGPGVFSEYWRNPTATADAFEDGWFRTSDEVEIDPATGYYKLLGRTSADIVNTGGYKVSALEIEEVLRQCPGVVDSCVVGAPDDVLGQRLVAAIVVEGDVVVADLQKCAEELLPRYKVPREYHVVDDFPRNVLGKVQKQVLRAKLGF